MPSLIGLAVALAVLLFVVVNAIRILPEYERGVVFRLGRLQPSDYGPGFFLLIPIVDRMQSVRVPGLVVDQEVRCAVLDLGARAGRRPEDLVLQSELTFFQAPHL